MCMCSIAANEMKMEVHKKNTHTLLFVFFWLFLLALGLMGFMCMSQLCHTFCHCYFHEGLLGPFCAALKLFAVCAKNYLFVCE